MRVGGPAKQLWQPVSVRARVAMFRCSLLRVCPWVWKSARWVEMMTLMVGWGGKRCCAQVLGLVWQGAFRHVADHFLDGILLLCRLPAHP